jgi:molybdopterin converting factor small subunit
MPVDRAGGASAGVAASLPMKITLKLYASLTEYLPADRRRGNELALDVREGATIDEVTAPFALPAKLVHLVLVNGHYVAPPDRVGRALAAGDVLAIWPPIAGG